MMCDIRPSEDARRIVGFDLSDDAGVFLLDDDTVLVQTVDVITPIVDDAEVFGKISATNALSDIYAMNARPLTALNIVMFPDKQLPLTVLSAIMRGGLAKCEEAGCALLGGHSLRDEEVKYGLAVTGVAKRSEIITNAGARVGDVVILTKPIGTGLVSTAIKRGRVSKKLLERAITSMTTLNKSAAQSMARVGANACTDVTGFGLLGHAAQLAKASEVTLEIEASKVPVLNGAWELVKKGMAPGGTKNNIKAYKHLVKAAKGLDESLFDLLFDPQTSGGLLITTPADKANVLVQELKKRRTLAPALIGVVKRRKQGIAVELK